MIKYAIRAHGGAATKASLPSHLRYGLNVVSRGVPNRRESWSTIPASPYHLLFAVFPESLSRVSSVGLRSLTVRPHPQTRQRFELSVHLFTPRSHPYAAGFCCEGCSSPRSTCLGAATL